MSTTIFDIELPLTDQPILMVGAGGIVNDAHLPAYSLAGFTVAGITDINLDKATATAGRFGINRVYQNLQAMMAEAPANAVYDIAVPGHAIAPLLRELPRGAAVLMQKPMGENLAQAKEILSITREKQMTAG